MILFYYITICYCIGPTYGLLYQTENQCLYCSGGRGSTQSRSRNLSALIKGLLFLGLIASCNSKEASAPAIKGEVYFTPQEVIMGLNALVTIIDWPADTVQHQKNLVVTPEDAKKLMLPLHPLWDEKVNEVASLMPDWDLAKINALIAGCAKKWEGDFYQEVLYRQPSILENSGPELKNFAGLKLQKTKEASLNCLQNMPSLQNLLIYLNKEYKNFEGESAY